MRLRTFLALTILLGLAAAIVLLLLPNREVLEQSLRVGTAIMPVWGAIVWAFALGVGVAVVFHVTGLGRSAFSRARSFWSARHREASRKAVERGLQAEREERMEEAIASYTEAVEKAPYDFRARMQLGDALRKSGHAERALTEHHHARALDPASDEPRHALALDFLELNELDRARHELRTLVERNPKGAAVALRQLRDLEMRAGSWEAAERAQAKLDALLGKPDRSKPDEWARTLGIRTELARARAHAGQPRGSINLLKKIVKDDPTFLPARLLLAEIKADTGAVDEARTLLVEGFDLTGEPSVLDALVDMLLRRERPEDAISTLRGQVAARKHSEAARLALGRLYSRVEMLDEAADQLNRLYEETGGAPLAAYHLGIVEERRGNGNRAAELYHEVLVPEKPVLRSIVCSRCDGGSPQWKPRCPHCGAFGTLSTCLGPANGRRTESQAAAPLYPVSRG